MPLTIIINLIALCINTCFNYLLIYGHFGFPRLEVKGAAIATVLARFVEVLIMNEFLWALGVTIFAVVYARMGTGTIAAINIFATVERISMVVCFGWVQAAAVMIGHRIGAGGEKDALCMKSKQLSNNNV
ncbi:MAG: hypothetical protein GXY86_07135 [Firmicutes bacterium]|nr:hypothetical protein [Bacillota bacterium]